MSLLKGLERELMAADERLEIQHAERAATQGALPRSRRPRARRSWHVFFTILAAGGVTTGALAATGNLPILQSDDRESNPNYMVFTIPGMDTKATAKPTILPMRVKDPQGGSPWALRTFPIGRGRLCAQAGQLYNGKFGVVTQVVDRAAAPRANGSAPAKTVFQELPPAAAMLGVRCGAARAGGQLVAANRITTIINPDGTDLRCGNRPPQRGVAPCPITAVKVVRWGFLGPQATTATFVQPGGRRGPTQQLNRATGGAYLFAEFVDPKPFRVSQEFERELRDKIGQRFPTMGSGKDRASDARMLPQRMRDMRAYARELADQARPQRRANWRAQQAEAVDATFSGAPPRRVAGPGSKGGPLPGVPPVVTSIPKVGSAEISATFRGRRRAVEVRFAAPAALDAHPGSYLISIRGPQNGACGKAYSDQAEYARETAAHEEVLVRVRTTHATPRHRWPSWCPNARYDVRVRYVVRNTNKPGMRSEQLVGKTTFEAR